MKVITRADLDKDVLTGDYLEIPVIVHFKGGKILKTSIDEYTHDEYPFANYIIIGEYRYGFDEIEKIEII